MTSEAANSSADEAGSRALVIRSQRVDYSVTKGGFRVWISLVLFLALIFGLTIFLAETDSDDAAEHKIEEDDLYEFGAKRPDFEEEIEEEPDLPVEKGKYEPDAHCAEVDEDELEFCQSGDSNAKAIDEEETEATVDEGVEKDSVDYDALEEQMLKSILAKQTVNAEQVSSSHHEGVVEPVRYIRRSGTKHSVSDNSNENIEESDSSSTHAQDIAVKFYRTKGKSSETAKTENVAVGDDPDLHNVEEDSDLHYEGDDSEAKLSSGELKEEMVDSEVEIEVPPLRYYRSKGKPRGVESSIPSSLKAQDSNVPSETVDALNEDGTISEAVSGSSDVTPVRYVRRKGKSTQTSLHAQELPQHSTVESPNDDIITDDKITSKDKNGDAVKQTEQKASYDDMDVGDKASSLDDSELPPVHEKLQYRKAAITNREDNKIRHKLDKADRLLDQRKLEEGLEAFQTLAAEYPRSPRANYGLARAFDLLSEWKQSNSFLEKAIAEYDSILQLNNVPQDLLLLTAQRIVDRARFRGWMHKAIHVHQLLLSKFPERYDLANDYGVTFLMMGRNDDAKRIFSDVLRKQPNDGFAQVHLGFILKTVLGDLESAVELLQAGILSEQAGTQDARFYFHLGDALQRLGRNTEAYAIYDKAAGIGLFMSRYQRSLYNVEGLKAQPWWNYAETGQERHLRNIEAQWEVIRDEGLSLLNSESETFEKEEEKLTHEGDWKQFVLYQKGMRNDANCKLAPKTCAILSKFTEATTCKRGQIKFSIMHPGTKVWPHCGPTNCRLRAHLGLKIAPEARLRVGNETKSWKAGEFLIFDDSFEHEVWHMGKETRLILIVDFWHPELSSKLKSTLSPI